LLLGWWKLLLRREAFEVDQVSSPPSFFILSICFGTCAKEKKACVGI
jgi:hypothetical protein